MWIFSDAMEQAESESPVGVPLHQILLFPARALLHLAKTVYPFLSPCIEFASGSSGCATVVGYNTVTPLTSHTKPAFAWREAPIKQALPLLLEEHVSKRPDFLNICLKSLGLDTEPDKPRPV
ncbi:hypothetical protein KCU88_g335, partial [Aureobasidium melanogenum]